MEFCLLGSLEASFDGELVELRSNRLRVVLAFLLLHVGRVVPVWRLVDALWDDDPPVTAKGQVQTCISALRHLLAEFGAGGLVSTSPAGYTIQVPHGSLDVVNFAELTARARAEADQRAEEAVQGFRAALALWRGRAAEDVRSRLVQTMAARLNEDRLVVLEECIQLELALGRHHSLVGELCELTREYPLREMLRAQHMLALYRSARQAEALGSFQEMRAILMEELGLEPSDRLRALQLAILSRDPGLDVQPEVGGGMTMARSTTVVVPRQLPAAISEFTGRQELLRDLVALLSAADGPDGRKYLPVASINGKGGVGKTALALQAAYEVRRLYPDGQLFVQLQNADGEPISTMELMAGVLRSLGLSPVALPEQVAERTAAYRSWLGERKILIVLDDAHSASQIMSLIPGSPSCGVIITSQHPLYSLPGAQHFEVGEFDEATAVDLLAKVVGPERIRAEPEAALTLVRLCDCLPLAVRIVAARLATRRHWGIGQMIQRMTDESRRLDELAIGGVGIRTTLATSYSSLSPSARKLFVRLSLLGTSDFAEWVSAPLLDMDVDVANDLFEVLIEARLVEVRINEDGSLRFRLHDLVRIYALERLAVDEPSADRFAALQRLLACWLSLAAEAHRRIYGGDYAVLHGSADLWRLPADGHDQLLGSPLNWLRTERAGLVLAVTQAAQVGLDELCWDLAVTTATLFESEYLVEDWQKTHEISLDATRRAGNVRGEAAVLFSLGILALNGRLSEAPRYLQSALHTFRQLGDAHGHALALAALAFADQLCGRSGQALKSYRRALAEYRTVGDRVGEIDVLNNLAEIHMSRESHGEAQQLLEKAFFLGRSLKAPRVAAQTEHRFGELYLRTNDVWRAERAFRSVLETVRGEGDLVGEAHALVGLGTARTLQGRHEVAMGDLSAALSLSRHMASSNLVHGKILLALAELHLAMGEPESSVPLINEALVIFSEAEPTPVWRARVLELKGRVDEQTGHPTAAMAARRQALVLAGDADSALSRKLGEAINAATVQRRGGIAP
jgi:DNA-binding SARP family transcriptional activator/tetratricopeptide (TPR) repeat protein